MKFVSVKVVLVITFFILIVSSLYHLYFDQPKINKVDTQDESLSINTDKITPTYNTLTAPSSLSEVQPVAQNSNNTLVLSLDLRWKFDDIIYNYQQHQDSIDQQLIILAEGLQLSKLATKQLFDLFYRYQNYTKALAELKLDSPDITENISQQLLTSFIETVQNLQLNYFTQEEIAAFFEQKNHYDQQALERLAIRQDPTLTEQQKQTLITNQIEQLPLAEQAAFAPSLQVNQIINYLKGDTQLIDNSNYQPLDNEALQRIQKLKIQRQQWLEKVMGYLELKDQFKNEAVTQDELQRYIEDNFTANEQRRLTVYENNPQLLTD